VKYLVSFGGISMVVPTKLETMPAEITLVAMEIAIREIMRIIYMRS
jgi:hypothetical protein